MALSPTYPLEKPDLQKKIKGDDIYEADTNERKIRVTP